jgi:hypothetical protein
MNLFHTFAAHCIIKQMGSDDNINTPRCGEENEENRYLLPSRIIRVAVYFLNGECAEKVNTK